MKKLTYIAAFLLVTMALLMCACGKDFTSIGLDLQDGSTLLGSHKTDTTKIVAISVIQDSIPTSKVPTNVFGYLNDPVFGQTLATAYTQYALKIQNVNFGFNPVVDSVVLTIRLVDAYGDTLTALPLAVYELDEDILDTTYYEDVDFRLKSENLLADPSQTFLVRPNSMVVLDSGAVDPHIRIPLKKEFGEYFIQNVSQLTTNENFKNFFKGLAIKCGGGLETGALVLCNFVTSISGITIYYHNDAGRSTCVFMNGNTELRANSYIQDHMRGTSTLRYQIFASDTTSAKDVLYCQGLGGVRTYIKFPEIVSAFKDKKIIVNKAELIIHNINDQDTYGAPKELGLQSITKAGKISVVPDDGMVTGNDALFGGVYDKDDQCYKFRITRYIQDLINEKETLTNELYLVTGGYANIPGRLVLGGTDPIDPDQRMRLEITYSRY